MIDADPQLRVGNVRLRTGGAVLAATLALAACQNTSGVHFDKNSGPTPATASGDIRLSSTTTDAKPAGGSVDVKGPDSFSYETNGFNIDCTVKETKLPAGSNIYALEAQFFTDIEIGGETFNHIWSATKKANVVKGVPEVMDEHPKLQKGATVFVLNHCTEVTPLYGWQETGVKFYYVYDQDKHSQTQYVLDQGGNPVQSDCNQYVSSGPESCSDIVNRP